MNPRRMIVEDRALALAERLVAEGPQNASLDAEIAWAALRSDDVRLPPPQA